MGLRSVIYARQSLDRSGEGDAVDRQLEACRRLAVEREWVVVEEYVDNSLSASKKNGNRPAYERMVASFANGGFEALICWDLDRLTRQPRQLEDWIDAAEERGLRLVTANGEADLSTDGGRMFARIKSSVARAEMERKGARQRDANLQRARRQQVGWTRRPFAYDRQDGAVTVVEPEAAALKRAASKVLDGATLASAVRVLDAEGLTTTAGKPWNVTTLRRALLNPRYAGRAVSNGEDHGQGAWPVLLDSATQERIADILRDPARRTAQGTEVKYLLSGLVRCGRCGAVMFASPMGQKGRRWMTYRCRTPHLARRLDLVDEVVVGVILGRLARPDAADLFAPDVNLDALRSEANDLRTRRDDLADLLADGLLSAARVRQQAKALGERLRAIEGQVNAAGNGDPLAALATADDVEATWGGLTIRARRDVVDTLVAVTILPAGKGVRFDPESVSIEWRQS